MNKLAFLLSMLFSCLALSAPQSIGGLSFDVIEEDPPVQLSFGLVTEYAAVHDPGLFGEYDTVIQVDGEVFYSRLDGKAMAFFDSQGRQLDSSGLKTCCGDEIKLGSLIEVLKPGITKGRTDLDIRMIKARKQLRGSVPLDNCDTCLTNNNCVIKPTCKNKCNWEAGFACCENENGSTCQTLAKQIKVPVGPLSCG